MKQSADEVINGLKLEFSGELTYRTGLKKRMFSKELKRRVASATRLNGVSLTQLSKGLGISLSALTVWRRALDLQSKTKATAQSSPFQKLEIEPDSLLNSDGDSSLYLETKSGVRVIGLNLNQISQLLRCL